ncbi:MAG: hypothetical protein AAF492_24335, partial [Verrucomicrobiota bacterium]
MSKNALTNYYKIIGVSRRATREEIKNAVCHTLDMDYAVLRRQIRDRFADERPGEDIDSLFHQLFDVDYVEFKKVNYDDQKVRERLRIQDGLAKQYAEAVVEVVRVRSREPRYAMFGATGLDNSDPDFCTWLKLDPDASAEAQDRAFAARKQDYIERIRGDWQENRNGLNIWKKRPYSDEVENAIRLFENRLRETESVLRRIETADARIRWFDEVGEAAAVLASWESREAYDKRLDTLIESASARIREGDKVLPCLLDRLTDNDPDHEGESAHKKVISSAQYRENVLRDLSWLLNTKAHLD